MKLAFSNIAFAEHDAPETWTLLQQHRVQGIEVAPTKVWPGWNGATPAAAREYRARLADAGFAIPALQAVLFDRPLARLFDDAGEEVLRTHLETVAALAGALGAGVVVLGAPKQRDRGALSPDAAQDQAAVFFRGIAPAFANAGSCLCIEPNPRRYQCNFVVNAREGAALVAAVDHPGFRLHLDAAGMFLEGDVLTEVWPQVGPYVSHFHISEPDLGDFRTAQVPHRANLDFLERAGFTGWRSVEMRQPTRPLAESGPWAILGTDANNAG